MNLSKLWETLEDRQSWCATVQGVAESDMTYQLSKLSNHRERIHTCSDNFWNQYRGDGVSHMKVLRRG